MLTYYSPAFIALAFTLAASVIGALVLAKVERGKERERENEKEGGVETEGTEGTGSEESRGAEMEEEGGR